MKKKIFSLLTGLSMIVLTGLLSIIPAQVCWAVPGNSLYVPEPGDTIYVDADSYSELLSTYNSSICYTNWTYYGVDPSLNTISNRGFNLIISSDGTQRVGAFTAFNDVVPDDAYATVSFNLEYNGVPYSGTLNVSDTTLNLLFITIYDRIVAFPVNAGFPLKEFYDSIDKKTDEIILALQGLNPDGSENPEMTVYYDFNGAISEKIIRALAQSEGVTLIYTFEYEGYTFRSTITSELAKEIMSPDIPWYGPCYIACNCPTEFVAVVAK